LQANFPWKFADSNSVGYKEIVFSESTIKNRLNRIYIFENKTCNFGSFYCLRRFIAALMLICVSLFPAIQSYAQYSCNITPIVGGGFVTGVITHQTSGDIYCRTDVGGAYC